MATAKERMLKLAKDNKVAARKKNVQLVPVLGKTKAASGVSSTLSMVVAPLRTATDSLGSTLVGGSSNPDVVDLTPRK